MPGGDVSAPGSTFAPEFSDSYDLIFCSEGLSIYHNKFSLIVRSELSIVMKFSIDDTVWVQTQLSLFLVGLKAEFTYVTWHNICLHMSRTKFERNNSF